jgi:hypothetical protein
MCCGQKRASIAGGGTPDRVEMRIYYNGRPSIRVRGYVTGRVYDFSAQLPVQSVDRRDSVPMLQSHVFRPLK